MNTKALMILGSVVGFVIGAAFGIASNSPWPSALWRACAAALVAAVLTRWWGRVLLSGLSDSLHQRHMRRPPAATVKQATKT
jgi:hypothetical protein